MLVTSLPTLWGSGQIVRDTRLGVMVIILEVFWLPLLLFVGLRSGVQDTKEGRNLGIRSAGVNACITGIGMFICIMLSFSIMSSGGYPLRLAAALSVMGGTACALAFGGVDIINHYLLRLIVYRYGYAPHKLYQFLEDCTKLIFLRRVGGGYIFIHRLLLEHFTAIWRAGRMQKGAKVTVS